MIDLKNDSFELWLTYVARGSGDWDFRFSEPVKAKSIAALAREISAKGCYLPIGGIASRLSLWRVEQVWHAPLELSNQPGRWSREHYFVCDLLEYPKQTISPERLKKLLYAAGMVPR